MHFFIEDVSACPACIPATPHYKKVSTVYAFRPTTPMLGNITGTIYIVATAAMTTEARISGSAGFSASGIPSFSISFL